MALTNEKAILSIGTEKLKTMGFYNGRQIAPGVLIKISTVASIKADLEREEVAVSFTGVCEVDLGDGITAEDTLSVALERINAIGDTFFRDVNGISLLWDEDIEFIRRDLNTGRLKFGVNRSVLILDTLLPATAKAEKPDATRLPQAN